MPLALPHREVRVVARKNLLKTEIFLKIQDVVDAVGTYLRGEHPLQSPRGF